LINLTHEFRNKRINAKKGRPRRNDFLDFSGWGIGLRVVQNGYLFSWQIYSLEKEINKGKERLKRKENKINAWQTKKRKKGKKRKGEKRKGARGGLRVVQNGYLFSWQIYSLEKEINKEKKGKDGKERKIK
jgi:hypothetical protein